MFIKLLFLHKKNYQKTAGFTLLEILIALFIFTIIAMLLTGALRAVINAQTGTENKSERLRRLQTALLILSRDIEQALSRPVLNPSNKEEAAFIGTSQSFRLTHGGLASAMTSSAMQLTEYNWNNGVLWRKTWPVLDQASPQAPSSRPLLDQVEAVQFEYVDKDKHLHSEWPLDHKSQTSLPRAVKITLTLTGWGKMSQLYIIAAQTNEENMPF